MDKYINMSIEEFQGYVEGLSFKELSALREIVFSKYEDYNTNTSDLMAGGFKHQDEIADKYRIFLGIVENEMAEKNETSQI